MKDFRDLIVWQKAVLLFEQCVADTKNFPKTEAARVIINQILRSVGSTSANIAEGFGRRKGKEYEHYLYIARGSINESLDWYEKLKRLKYIDEASFSERQGTCNEIRAMLTAMIDKVHV
ncbi:MAG: four helix bundle protein [Nitrospinae bacterium]|nr:four helix bundle protein [Nitrospinota bacterium]